MRCSRSHSAPTAYQRCLRTVDDFDVAAEWAWQELLPAHLSVRDVKRELLPYWFTQLRPPGFLARLRFGLMLFWAALRPGNGDHTFPCIRPPQRLP